MIINLLDKIPFLAHWTPSLVFADCCEMATNSDKHSHDHHHHNNFDHDHSHEDSSSKSWLGPDGKLYHSHDGLAPHSHEPIYSPGYFSRRAPPLLARDFNERAFTVGIGGPVGTGYFLFSFYFSSLLI